ncbi:MAG: hypothetical protein VKP62_08730 [Candidatus Sericytochromatia bacterium]|nr:hypothetical protein [Candidatus Sericytochromatia bacterium]
MQTVSPMSPILLSPATRQASQWSAASAAAELATAGPAGSGPQGVVASAVWPQNNGYNWNYLHPRDHIFDHPYDGWALNRGLMQLGGVRFWTRYAWTRAIASSLTKIPEQRLHAYAVREQFMRVPGMRPDHARLLQLAYQDQTMGRMPLHRLAALSWLGQYGAPGDVNDWVLRGPFLLTLHAASVQYAMGTYHAPAVPSNRELAALGQAALMIAPPAYQPPSYGHTPGYGAPPPGYGGYPGYGADPITQIGNLIGQIGQLFR